MEYSVDTNLILSPSHQSLSSHGADSRGSRSRCGSPSDVHLIASPAFTPKAHILEGPATRLSFLEVDSVSTGSSASTSQTGLNGSNIPLSASGFWNDQRLEQLQTDGLEDVQGNRYNVADIEEHVIHAFRDDGRPVAIKPCKRGYVDCVEARSKLYSELQKLEELRHSHIVEMLGFLEMDGYICTVMEYTGAVTLKHIMQKAGFLKPRQAAPYISDVLDGLDYLHSMDVVHGNIKPENVFLTPEGRCKLTDFGLTPPDRSSNFSSRESPIKPEGMVSQMFARRVSLTRSCENVTAMYAAPENRRDGRTPQADIWGVGALLLQIVTGTLPKEDLFDTPVHQRVNRAMSVRRLGRTSSRSSENLLPSLGGFSKSMGDMSGHLRHSTSQPDSVNADIHDSLPSQLQDFLTCCLNRDPDARPNAKTLMHHEFVTEFRPAIFSAVRSDPSSVLGTAYKEPLGSPASISSRWPMPSGSPPRSPGRSTMPIGRA